MMIASSLLYTAAYVPILIILYSTIYYYIVKDKLLTSFFYNVISWYMLAISVLLFIGLLIGDLMAGFKLAYYYWSNFNFVNENKDIFAM